MPAPINLELRGLQEAQAKAEQVLRDLHGAPVLDAARNATLLVERTAKQHAKVDRGIYRSSITPTVEQHGETVVGIVGSNLDYAKDVVLGTPPHWPPIREIQEWVHRKGLGGSGRGRNLRRASASVERSIAFLIARKIAHYGTKGDLSLIKGIEQNATRIYRLFEQAVSRAVNQ